MDKVAMFVFNGNQMCFTHVLLNAIDMDSKGIAVKIVIEGAAVKLIKELEESSNSLYQQTKDKGLIDCICKGCSAKMGVLEFNQTVGIPLRGDMKGHPPFAAYIEQGYAIVTL